MTLSLAAIDIAEQGVLDTTPVDLNELTTISLTGTGVFDVLMQSMKLHLQEEYDNNRITGKEYAQVCSNMMAAVLQQSVSFLLQQQQVVKTKAEIALVRQQTVTELAQTDDDIPAGLGFNNSTSIEGIVAQQRIALEKTIEKTDADINLTNQQTVTELAQTDDYIPAGSALNTGTTVDGVIALNKSLVEAQIASSLKEAERIDSEVIFTKQKTVTELAQTAEFIPSGIGHNVATTVDGVVALNKSLVTAQIAASLKEAEKIDADVVFTNQKTISELAQTSDTIVTDLGLNDVTTVTGMVKIQKDIAAKQANLIDAQIINAGHQNAKTLAESTLLKQKTVTELAQTSDTIPWAVGALNPNEPVEGTTKKQKDLYAAQTDGFVKDAQQKVLKHFTDIWSIQRTTDSGLTVPPGMTNADITKIARAVADGIGVTL